jgi:hypothetical protein
VVFPMIFHRFPVIFPRNILHFYGFSHGTYVKRPAGLHSQDHGTLGFREGGLASGEHHRY